MAVPEGRGLPTRTRRVPAADRSRAAPVWSDGRRPRHGPRPAALWRLGRRREILIEDAGNLRGTPALGKSNHLEDPHVAVERDGDDVAGTHRAARCVDARAVDADEAGVGKRRSGRARPHHARVPQPFVDALPIQRKTQRSLLPSSCAFRARSLANGEFGSGSLLLRGSSLDPQIRSGPLSRPERPRSRSRSRRGGRPPEPSFRSGRSRRSGRPCLSGRPCRSGRCSVLTFASTTAPSTTLPSPSLRSPRLRRR